MEVHDIDVSTKDVQMAVMQLASNDLFKNNPGCLQGFMESLMATAKNTVPEAATTPTPNKRSMEDVSDLANGADQKESTVASYKKFWTKFKRVDGDSGSSQRVPATGAREIEETPKEEEAKDENVNMPEPAEAEDTKIAEVAKEEHVKMAAKEDDVKKTELTKEENEKKAEPAPAENEKKAELAKEEKEKKTELAKEEKEKKAEPAPAENDKKAELAKEEKEKNVEPAPAKEEKEKKAEPAPAKNEKKAEPVPAKEENEKKAEEARDGDAKMTELAKEENKKNVEPAPAKEENEKKAEEAKDGNAKMTELAKEENEKKADEAKDDNVKKTELAKEDEVKKAEEAKTEVSLLEDQWKKLAKEEQQKPEPRKEKTADETYADEFERDLNMMVNCGVPQPRKEHVFAPNADDVRAALMRKTTVDLEREQPAELRYVSAVPEVPAGYNMKLMLVGGKPTHVLIPCDQTAVDSSPPPSSIPAPEVHPPATAAPEESEAEPTASGSRPEDADVLEVRVAKGDRALKNSYMRFHRSIHSILASQFTISQHTYIYIYLYFDYIWTIYIYIIPLNCGTAQFATNIYIYI